ncbi:efflux RND transporter periplasmic adaptor subunit [Candidatus Sumerlaeota bacterium]|nr:efflux RND transporter periplasmic adaptor subunit [Candidatus Sumerlaeota bacterium]
MKRTLFLSLSAMALTLAPAACGKTFGRQQAAQSKEGHGHADEAKSAQITVWDDRFEIFLEHEYMVANRPVRFVTHVTEQQSLEPRRSGPLTFVLRQDGRPPIEHEESAPARDGIYIPELTFPAKGQWDVSLVAPLDGARHTIGLPPFTVYGSSDEAAHAPDPEEFDGISFLKEQQWKVGTKTEPALRRSLTEQLRLTGVVSAPPHRRARVTPFLAGKLIVPAGRKFPAVGDRVEAGQTLALVQPPLAGSDYLSFVGNQNQIKTLEVDLRVKRAEAEALATKTRVSLEHAGQALKRIRALHQQGAKSERELQEAIYAEREARAELDAAVTLEKAYDEALKELAARPAPLQPEAGLPAVELKAPISGVISAVEAVVGEHVKPDQPVLAILDTQTVLIEARVPESQWARVGRSYGASYRLPGHTENSVSILGEGKGRLLYAGSEVDAKTRTVRLVYEIPNPEGRLRIGMALDVFVETTQGEETLAVPESALIEEEGRAVVFVQLGGETFAKRDVQPGIRDNGFVQIRAGLKEGERVVTRGAYAVRLASVASSIPEHGHAH